MTPGRSYRGDQALHRTTLLSIAVGFGPLMGLVISGGLGRPELFGPLAMVIGPAAALTTASTSASSLFLWYAGLWHVSRGGLPAPWRLMSVLDDCHRLGLLRAVGPVYQFRHAELQDHLAPPPGA